MEMPHPVYTRGGRKGEREVDALGPRLEPGFDQDLARGLVHRNDPAFADEDAESDDESVDVPVRSAKAVNPFLMSANEANAEAGSSSDHSLRPDHPQASPTHLRRKRIDKDRAQMGARKLFGAELDKAAPPKVPAKMGKGWEDTSNPFIDSNPSAKPRPIIRKKEPEMMGFVFRGKRITYDTPLSHLLDSPDSPDSDEPFHKTVPRRLWDRAETTPPAPKPDPRANVFRAARELPPSHLVSPRKRPLADDHGLPTPVQESRKKARQDDWDQKLKR